MSSSKRKPGLMMSGPAHKRAQFASSGSSAFGGYQKSKTENQQTSFLTNGIQRKSNNRREWMKECLKLLETLSDREEAKPFQVPVDCVRYPEFYSFVDEAIDLSKVMLKFRGGQYQDPFQFEKDVRQLFHDNQNFFKEKEPEIYTKCCILDEWFSEEFQKILTKYGDKLKRKSEPATVGDSTHSSTQNTNITVSINNGSCTILQANDSAVKAETETTNYVSSWQQQNVKAEDAKAIASHHLLSHYIRMGVTPQYPTLLYPPPPPHGHLPLEISPRHSPYMDQGLLAVHGRQGLVSTLHAMHRQTASEGDYEKPKVETKLPQQSSLPLPHYDDHEMKGSGSRDASPFRNYWPRTAWTTTESSCGGSSGSRSCSLSPRPRMEHSSSSLSTSPHRWSASEGLDKKAAGGGSHKNTVGMELERCTVWFGNVKTKCHRPVVIHETGIKMTCTYDGQVYYIKLRPDEIIRCSAQLGQMKHHILFFFVLPNFLRRLCDMIPELSSLLDHRSHLVVLFSPPLSMLQVSRLVHIFHCMQHDSPFGTLFNEINQPTAIKLLANIKPELLQAGNEVSRRHLLMGCHKNYSSSTETEDDGSGPSCTVSSRNFLDPDMARSMVNEPSKAYKPKFHFRRQKLIPKQSSASSEPDVGHLLGVRSGSLEEARSKSLQTDEKNMALEVDSDLEFDFDLEDDEDQKCPKSFVLNSSVVEEDMAVDPSDDMEDGDIHQFHTGSQNDDHESMDTKHSDAKMLEIRIDGVKIKDPETAPEKLSPQPHMAEGPRIAVLRNKVCGHYYNEQELLMYMKQKKDDGHRAWCPVEGCISQQPLDLSLLQQADYHYRASVNTGQ